MSQIIKYIVCYACLLTMSFARAQSPGSEAMLVQLQTAKQDTAKAAALDKLINVCIFESRLQRADSLNEAFHQLSDSLNFLYGQLDYLLNKARIAEARGDYKNALELNLAALSKAEPNHLSKLIGRSSNNIGIIYFTQGNYEKALEYYQKAVKNAVSDPRNAAVYLNNIGNIYFKKRDYDVALEYYTRSLKAREQKEDKNGIANANNNIGSVYLEMKQYDKALASFKSAEQLQLETGNKAELAYSLLNEGLVCSKMQQTKLAEASFLKGLELAKSVEAPDIIRDADQALSEFYNEQNNPAKALVYYKEFIRIRDTLNNGSLQKEIANKELNFEFEKKALEIKLEQEKKDLRRNEEARRQQLITWSVVAGLFIVMVFAVISYKRYKTTQKQKTIIEEQKLLVEEKQKEVIDSINYAKRLQTAILVPESELAKSFAEAMIIYQPKDIVSGDFYWFAETMKYKIVAVADCTGHGVPGGFMSMLGYETLQNTLLKETIETTSQALEALDHKLTETLNKSARTFRDGMDIALCAFSKTKNTVQYSGANRPLLHVSDGALTVHTPDKCAIGGNIDGTARHFSHTEIPVKKGDVLYLFTDGYVDQFGMPAEAWAKAGGLSASELKGKKFKFRQLQELILSGKDQPLKDQKEHLLAAFGRWKGSLEQVDDVCIIAVKI